MLAVVNRVTLAHFTAREIADVSAVTKRPRLEADHRAKANPRLTASSPCLQHAPVDDGELVLAEAAGSMRVGGFVEKLGEYRAMQHDRPPAPVTAGAEHRADIRQPGRARRLARRKEFVRTRHVHVLVRR